ncbi:hypothetical protein [Methylobacterium indicum]|nr:hypothetical protein [Methylobacterium indicum]
MSQHPNASPSPLAGEIAAVIGEFVTAQANAMHAVARLAMLTRDLVEGTAPQTSAPEVRQEIADLAQRLSPVVAAEPRTNRTGLREIILDLYATTNLTGYAIARRVGVALDTPSKLVRKARAAGDRRAAQGDLLRRDQPADQAAPLHATPSTPHDGLPENGGNASPARPEETGALGKAPAQGEEVVPTSRAGEELTTSDDPAPAPEPNIVAVDLGKVMGVVSDVSGLTAMLKPTEAGHSVIDALRSANERILRPASEMELADELEDEPAPRRAVPQEPVTEVGLPILHIDTKGQKVIGPLGTWGGCSPIVLTVMARLADGNLYGQPVLQKLAGFARPETFDTVLKRWRDELREIGVEMFVGPAGIRLQRQEIV